MANNPQMLMAVSVGLILTCIIVIILFIVFVHTMPGKIARKRGNPQEEAIEILSLLGLLIFPLWMAALVWAYLKPFTLSVALADQRGAGQHAADQSGAAASDPASAAANPQPQAAPKPATGLASGTAATSTPESTPQPPRQFAGAATPESEQQSMPASAQSMPASDLAPRPNALLASAQTERPANPDTQA